MQRVKKRFTDTLKWEKEWFLSLEVGDKIVWLYLLDNCDEAGLWNVNWRLCSMLTGVNLGECPKAIQHQLIKTNHDKVIYIKDFMSFQYPDYLEKRSPMIAKCVNRLIGYGVIKQADYDKVQKQCGIQSGNQSGRTVYTTVQEKEEEKETEKVKEKEIKKVIDTAIKRNKLDVSLKSIDSSFLADLQAKHMDVDIEDEFEKFKDYLSANGKNYKDYQAAFRNWVKSEYTPKTDKIKVQSQLDKQLKKDLMEKQERQKQEEAGELVGPPKEFLEDIRKLTNKFKTGD